MATFRKSYLPVQVAAALLTSVLVSVPAAAGPRGETGAATQEVSGPCTEESAAEQYVTGEGHDHVGMPQHEKSCGIEQSAFLPLTEQLDDEILGEMDAEAGIAAVAVTYPQAGVLFFDVSDPSKPKFLSRYKSAECEGLAIDVDCGAFVDVSPDGKAAYLALQQISILPGRVPDPDAPLPARPGVEVIDISDPENPVRSDFALIGLESGGSHTTRSHVVPEGFSPDAEPGEYLYSMDNGGAIVIHRVNKDASGARTLEEINSIPTDEIHDSFIANDPIDKRVYLYLASGLDTGFLVWDVTDPTAEKLVAEWDLTPQCEEDWYAHTIDVTYRGDRRYVTMPAELFTISGEQSDDDRAEGCGQIVGNGDKPGPLWIVDASDFSKLGPADAEDTDAEESVTEEALRANSANALVATWTNAASRAGGNLLFSPHNQQIVGDKIYLSGYHSGVTVLDASEAFAGKRGARPRELAFVVPSGTPTRPLYEQQAGPVIPFVSTFTDARPLVWDQVFYVPPGGKPEDGRILAADMTGGFYSYRETQPSDKPATAESAPDISKLEYAPIGQFKPGDPLPPADTGCAEIGGQASDGTAALRFNPSGKWNAFDTNVFETLCLPYRQSEDQDGQGNPVDDDPAGNGGDPRHGYCAQPSDPIARPGNPALMPGVCPNHQREYVKYFGETMREVLGDFGVTIHEYEFEIDDPGAGGNTMGGTAVNVAAVVPGATHPDETVLVSGHFDQTNDGPASAWGSAEGHAQVIRTAKLMADYWRATGTRPAATVKFIPWDGEESGTLGSLDYATNNIVPGQENKVRSYWNTDPCAGGYPAFRFGNPADRVDLGIQVANPDEVPAASRARVDAFNAKAPQLVEEVFEHLDDTLMVGGSEREIFVATSEADADTPPDIGNDVTVGTGRPQLFTSDWRNFEVLGIPFFNPGPEITGPNDDGSPGNPDALAILHTPNDNLQTLNQYTGSANASMSEGWIKGMEMCAHLLAWGMLQPEHGGGQPVDDRPVAYFEALPNEATAGKPVGFDAGGSHQTVSFPSRRLVPDSELTYEWTFGDGTTGTGKTLEHTYTKPGIYTAKLTVRGHGGSDTMSLPITVLPVGFAPPVLTAPASDADGTFDLTWTHETVEGQLGYAVEEAPDGVARIHDRADALGGWSANEPGNGIDGWQLSDSSTQKNRGNLSHSGPRSFYTGVGRANHTPGVGPNEGESVLTLAQPISLPKGDSVELSYWSDFANDANDVGRVEVQIEGDHTWQVVDALGRDERDRDTMSLSEEATEGSVPSFELRRLDLTRFAGRTVKLRFVYDLGDAQYVNVYRMGWYVDDIRLVTGNFTEIGRTTGKSFPVEERKPGSYAYRVLAVFPQDVKTAPSNVELVTVTGRR